MEIAKERNHSLGYVIAKSMAIAAVIALCYFTLTMLTPSMSITGTGLGIRLANGLKAFTLLTPAAPFGLAFGVWSVDIADGRIGWGLYALGWLANVVTGLAAYYLAAHGKRSKVKDFIILGVLGIVMGLWDAMNKALALPGHAATIFAHIWMVRAASGLLSHLSGFPLYLIARGFKK